MGCKETLGGYGLTVRLHGLEISLMPGVVDPGRHEVEALLPEGGAERVPKGYYKGKCNNILIKEI